MDTETIKNQIGGLEERLKVLDADEKIFIRAQGMQIEETKYVNEKVDKEQELETVLEEIKDLAAKKAAAMESTCRALSERMGEVLPFGTAMFEITDGKVEIGWGTTPYRGLSGSEKSTFDGSLGYALGADTIFYEAAESSYESIQALLDRTAESSKQILILTWAGPEAPGGHVNYRVPDEFDVVELGGGE